MYAHIFGQDKKEIYFIYARKKATHAMHVKL